MAESKFISIIKKIKVPKFLIPASILKQMEILLANANIAFSATEWMGIFFVTGFIFFLIAALLFSLLIGFGVFIAVTGAMFLLPRMQMDKRRAKIEETLPDALHHMSVAIRTGLVLESVIQEISESDYGALSEEFTQIVVEMRRGRSLRDALLAFSKRIGSKEVERATRLLLEGIESGGPISDVLDEVSEDMRAVRMIQRERKTMTQQQTSFLAMASLMAGPFVMGVVAALPSIMLGMAAGFAEAQFPIDDINKVIVALNFYVVAQAVASAIMMGVVMYGSMKKGFKFVIPMGIVAYIVFFGVKKVMPSALAAFG